MSGMADATLSAELEKLWRDAIKAYQDEVGQDNAIYDAIEERITSAEQLGVYIETRGDAFKSFRTKHKKVYEKAQLLIAPMEFLAKVMSPMSNDPTWGLPMSIITAGIAHLFQVGNGVADSYDWIEEVFTELLPFTRNIEARMQPPVDDVMRRQVAQIIAYIIRIIGRSQRLIQDRHFKQYLRVAFLGKDKKTEALTKQLTKLLGSNDSLTLSLTYEKVGGIATSIDKGNAVSKDIVTSLDQFHNKFNDLTAVVNNGNASAEAAAAATAHLSSQAFDESLRKNMKASFRTKAFDDNIYWLSEHARKLSDASGSWLGEERLYKEWKSKGALTLWVLGPPGSGKSMLCTRIIQDLQAESDLAENDTAKVNLAFFYMRQDNKELSTINSLFKTMIWQLQENDRAFQRHVAQQCRSTYKIAGPEQIWENCLLSYYASTMSTGHRAILVIDGLDEIEPSERKILLDIIERYRSNGASRKAVQFAVFGREELKDDLRKAGLDDDRHVIRVSSDKNSQDLREYIKSRIQKLEIIVSEKKASRARRDEANKRAKQLQEQIYKLADGVFLWAQIFLDQMQDQEWPAIRQLLKHPPSKLDDMILTVFARLNQEVQDSGSSTDRTKMHDLERILLWACECKRPLKFFELEFILRMKDNEPRRLLWDKLRDKWASVLTLHYPRNHDPDLLKRTDERDSGVLEMSGSASGETSDSDANTAVHNDDLDSHTGDPDSGASTDDDTFSTASDGMTDAGSDSPQLESSDSTAVWCRYDRGQLYTIVSFAHARFQDIVRERSDAASKGNPTLSIFQNIQHADYLLFLDCITMIARAMEEDRNIMQQRYLNYPIANIVLHLEAMRFDELDLKQRISVVEGLYWLFNSKTGCKAFFIGLDKTDGSQVDTFWRFFFTEHRYTQLVQEWFQKIPNVGSAEQVDWMKQASQSIEVLLKPLAQAAARRWLEKDSHGDLAYLDSCSFEVLFLKAYTSLASTGTLDESYKNFNWMKASVNLGTNPTELEDLANWANLEKTTHWHTGVGWTLFQTGYFDAALEHCQKAIELDDGAWLAMEASARTLGKQGKYHEAVEKINLAMAKLPASYTTSSSVKSYFLTYASEWYGELGDNKECLRLAREYVVESTAHQANNFGMRVITHLANVLHKEEEWEELRDTLVLLDKTIWSHEQSVLSHCKCDDIGFVLEAAQAAIPDIEAAWAETDIAFYLFDLARCYYSFARDERKFITLFDDAAKRTAAIDNLETNKGTDYYKQLKPLYARVSFDMAVAQSKMGKVYNKPASKLKELATNIRSTTEDTTKDKLAIQADDYAVLLWGRWLREYTEIDESTWKSCFGPRVSTLLAGLEDEDPMKYIRACKSLAITLFHAGDRESAAEILAILFHPQEKLIQDDGVELDGQQQRENIEINHETEETHPGTEGQREIALRTTDATPSDLHEHSQMTDRTALENDLTAPAVDLTRASATGEPTGIELSDKAPQKSSETAHRDPVQDTGFESGVSRPLVSSIALEHVVDNPGSKAEMTAIQIRAREGQETMLNSKNSFTQHGDLELDLSKSWGYLCDGCNETTKKTKSMWFCEICHNTNFCNECLDCVKKEISGKNLCSTNHRWYQAYPIPKEYSDRIVFGQSPDTVVLKKEWLDNLRKRWLTDVPIAQPDKD